MATTIRALCKFSNERYLSHLDGATIETGETAQVVDHYAQKLRKRGLVEIVEDEEAPEDEGEAKGDADADMLEGKSEEPEGEWALGESAGAGFYYALYDGERVEDEGSRSGYNTVGRGKDEAQAEIDRRNDEGLTPADIFDE